MTKTIKPPVPHDCVLGGAGTVPRGTLRQCDGCEKWWFTGTYYYANGINTEVWYPVSWYHFRKNARIKRGYW